MMSRPRPPAQLVAAAPLPDEFIAGHIGRLAQLNGSSSLEHFILRLTARGPEESISFSPLQIFQRAAKLSGLDENAYLARHTLCPLEHLCAPTEDRAKSYTQESHLRQRTRLLRLHQPAGLCTTCVEEDIAVHGFSYWRRTHQIQGIDWCPAHRQPLQRVIKSAPFSVCPSNWLRHQDFLTRAPIDSTDNSVIHAYEDIALWLLAAERRTTKARVGALLSHGVEAHQLRAGMKGKGPRISDLAREKTSDRWLKLHFPKIADGAAHTYCPAIDAALFGTSCSPYSVILALSVLGLAERPLLSRALLDGQAIIRARDQRDIQLRDRALDAYLCSGGSYEKARRLMGIANSSAFCLYQRLGLPSLSRADPEAAAQIICFLRTASGEERDRWMQRVAASMRGGVHFSPRWIRDVPFQMLPPKLSK